MSMACGIQMPVALYLRGDGKSGVIQAFSADLIGAAAGTLITSVILIPYIGIIWTALCLAGLKLISAGLMFARSS
jgi:spermidine synthase